MTTYTIVTYISYLILSFGLTIWVGRSLHRSGRIFLVDACHGNQGLADSMNHLLLVGFYLVNFGFVTLYLTNAGEVEDLVGTFRALSTQVGTVLLVLGGMHFFNLFAFYRLRKSGRLRQEPPPVDPDYAIERS